MKNLNGILQGVRRKKAFVFMKNSRLDYKRNVPCPRFRLRRCLDNRKEIIVNKIKKH